MDAAYFDDKTQDIRARIERFLADGLKVFVTSSFQTHSIPLLHILRGISKEIPVYFIDTGFHFPETIAFRDQVAELLDLTVRNTRSVVCKSLQCDADGNLLFASDPDHCCYLNKTQPLEPVLIEMDVWVNGIRGDQSEHRRRMSPIEKGPFGTLRYHPLLDWNSREVYYYRKLHSLPPHPLEARGYLSIGCEPCTRRLDPSGEERQGRWFGLKKTECGLHTELVEKR